VEVKDAKERGEKGGKNQQKENTTSAEQTQGKKNSGNNWEEIKRNDVRVGNSGLAPQRRRIIYSILEKGKG